MPCSEDTLLAGIAAAIGEPARTRMLLSLMDGHARTGTELAAIAEVTPSTASAHLSRLRESNLISVAAQGRHRYYSLRSREVGALLEGLSVVAGAGTRTFVPGTPASLRKARSCYDHMAGTLAVALHDCFVAEGWLLPDSAPGPGGYRLSGDGVRKLEQIGIDIQQVSSLRRRFAYPCLDWSERRPHLAGGLAAAILQQLIARKWVVRELDSRALHLTRLGEREFSRLIGRSV